jgi:glycosyltransferase involved in cell wall biosynthesis
MSSKALVSVCLPVFNGARHLEAAIESILQQSHDELELLIADDGSTDGSVEIALRFAEKDKRVKFWRNQQRHGLFGNYNVCINKASGVYIKPFAQDDLLCVDAIETLCNVLESDKKIVLASSSRQIIDDIGALTELKQPMSRDLRAPGKEVVMFHLIALNNWVGEPSTVLFRAEHKGNGFDASYYHYGDIEYWCRILLNGSYFYSERPLASFRRHAASQTDKNHRELYFALDILRFSLSYRHLISDLESVEHMQRRICEKIALEHGHVASAADVNLLDYYQRAFLQAELPGKAGGSPASESSGFRLLASMALNTVSQLIAELDHEKRCRADEHERFVSEVDKMRNSLYWKLSAPLRNLRNAIKPRDGV